MMYYALTVKDNLITGVHTSAEPFKSDQFKCNQKLSGDTVVPFESGEYAAGHDMREYEFGKLRPIADRVKDGLSDVPIGFELIDGELCQIDAPIEEQPLSIRQMIETADARIAALEDEIAKMRSSVPTLSQDVALTEPMKRTI